VILRRPGTVIDREVIAFTSLEAQIAAAVALAEAIHAEWTQPQPPRECEYQHDRLFELWLQRQREEGRRLIISTMFETAVTAQQLWLAIANDLDARRSQARSEIRWATDYRLLHQVGGKRRYYWCLDLRCEPHQLTAHRDDIARVISSHGGRIAAWSEGQCQSIDAVFDKAPPETLERERCSNVWRAQWLRIGGHQPGLRFRGDYRKREQVAHWSLFGVVRSRRRAEGQAKRTARNLARLDISRMTPEAVERLVIAARIAAERWRNVADLVRPEGSRRSHIRVVEEE
jgi:hypothetical protein